MLITESIYELLHSTSVLVLLPLEPDPPPAVFHFLICSQLITHFMRGGRRVRDLSASLVDGFRKLLNSNREDLVRRSKAESSTILRSDG
jgi:hypothetical protein